MRRLLPAYIGTLMLTASAPAMAQYSGVVEVDLNMRAGPSTSFPVVTTIPSDTNVTINGCIDGYDWCDVSWSNNRGWVYGEYVNYQHQGRYVPIAEVRTGISVPIVSFSFNTYWDNYYRDRPWYGSRDRWRSVWRSDPRYDRIRTGRDWDRDGDRRRVGDRDDRRWDRDDDRRRAGDRDDDRRRFGDRDDRRRFGDRDRDDDQRRTGRMRDRDDDDRRRAGDDRRDRDRVGGRTGRDADRSDRSERFGSGSPASRQGTTGTTTTGQTPGTSSEQTGSINRPATGSTPGRGSDAGDRGRMMQRGGGTSPSSSGSPGAGSPGGSASPGAGGSGGGNPGGSGGGSN